MTFWPSNIFNFKYTSYCRWYGYNILKSIKCPKKALQLITCSWKTIHKHRFLLFSHRLTRWMPMATLHSIWPVTMGRTLWSMSSSRQEPTQTRCVCVPLCNYSMFVVIVCVFNCVIWYLASGEWEGFFCSSLCLLLTPGGAVPGDAAGPWSSHQYAGVSICRSSYWNTLILRICFIFWFSWSDCL